MYSEQVYKIENIVKNPKIKFGFLRGAGGTGKTFSISKYIEMAKLNHTQYVFMGPTGKSVSVAEEKGLVGCTIHRFFKIQTNDTEAKIKRYITYKYGGMDQYYIKMRQELFDVKMVFIDEISMINDQMFMHILETLIKCTKANTTIFLSGDFHQLPPVIKDKVLTSSLQIIDALMNSPQMEVIDYVTRFRSPNEEFNKFLHDLRMGSITKVKDISTFLRIHTNVYTRENYPDEIENKFTFLTQTNKDVDEINSAMLHGLDGELYESEYKIKIDECTTGFKEVRQQIIDDFQMDKVVTFKVGSKILFRVNHMDEQFKNGEEGIVESVKPGSVMIRKIHNNVLIEVRKHIYSTSDLEKKDGFNLEIEQWPFSLGNARTIHKAQGDGFEYLHLNFGFLTNYNHLSDEDKWHLFYVSLSRIMDPSKVYISDISMKTLECQYSLFKNINYKKLSLSKEITEYIPRKEGI